MTAGIYPRLDSGHAGQACASLLRGQLRDGRSPTMSRARDRNGPAQHRHVYMSQPCPNALVLGRGNVQEVAAPCQRALVASADCEVETLAVSCQGAAHLLMGRPEGIDPAIYGLFPRASPCTAEQLGLLQDRVRFGRPKIVLRSRFVELPATAAAPMARCPQDLTVSV